MYDPGELWFETPIKLHYSQTFAIWGIIEWKFETPIKLHYSQTSKYNSPLRTMLVL